MKRKRKSGSVSPKPRYSGTSSRRGLAVVVSLLGLLSITSVLLLALSPAPLVPATASSLFALDAPQSMDEIFHIPVPARNGRWKYVFLHDSNTPAGSAMDRMLRDGQSDHFVIGNGNGAMDGEIQMTPLWTGQQPAGPIAGIEKMDADCISICLIGDFNQSRPTPTQALRLNQLVSTLQSRLGIGSQQILMIDDPRHPAGIGRNFPSEGFRDQLLQ